ncbi:uncharacterized protein [Salminus brasiliensis]|uniref:uncharacterized protein n=1 Tax=Salminus brasiliensis TaxID=930266 RepID=UPI003B832DC7
MMFKLDLFVMVLLSLDFDGGSADPDPPQLYKSVLSDRSPLMIPRYELKEPLGRPSVRVRTVLVTCYPTHMEVRVKADLFGLGMLVDPADLRLGPDGPSGLSCGVSAVSDEEYTIQFGLTDCGTQHWVTEDTLIYTNLLTYSPAPSLDGLVRMENAGIPVECHYRRRFDIDSDPVLPTWIPHQTTAAALENLLFTLRLMSSDWRGERGSTVFFLGDVVNVEAGLYLPQMNLRVFIENCVATATPDPHSVPKYHFIENGCLLDGRLTGSQSHFLPRERPDKLRLQLGAFMFPQVEASQIYVTCTLKAYPLDYVSKSMSKACSFIQGSWRSAEGDDWTCNSCEDQFQPTQSNLPKWDQAVPTYRPKTDPTELPPSPGKRTLFKPALQSDSAQWEPVRLRPGKSGASSTHSVQEPTSAWRSAGGSPRMVVIIMVIMTTTTMISARASPAPAPVRVHCTERAMVVSLNAHALRSGNVRLGTCGLVVERETELVLHTELHECGSTLRLDGDSLVYENLLSFVPEGNPFGIVRSTRASVPVQCRYPRTHFVSTNDLQKPTGQLPTSHQPGSSTPPQFSLHLMKDDWRSERSSFVFRQGDVVNLKASVMGAERTPAKLYLDSCVITLQPDIGHPPRYPLIHNHGCAANPRSHRPTVQFLPRTEDHALRLQMDNHRFYQSEQNTVYIWCLLKVTDAAEGESSVNKACSYSGDRWRSADGKHTVCDCCESVCEEYQSRVYKGSAAADSGRSAVVTLGPVVILH